MRKLSLFLFCLFALMQISPAFSATLPLTEDISISAGTGGTTDFNGIYSSVDSPITVGVTEDFMTHQAADPNDDGIASLYNNPLVSFSNLATTAKTIKSYSNAGDGVVAIGGLTFNSLNLEIYDNVVGIYNQDNSFIFNGNTIPNTYTNTLTVTENSGHGIWVNLGGITTINNSDVVVSENSANIFVNDTAQFNVVGNTNGLNTLETLLSTTGGGIESYGVAKIENVNINTNDNAADGIIAQTLGSIIIKGVTDGSNDFNSTGNTNNGITSLGSISITSMDVTTKDNDLNGIYVELGALSPGILSIEGISAASAATANVLTMENNLNNGILSSNSIIDIAKMNIIAKGQLNGAAISATDGGKVNVTGIANKNTLDMTGNLNGLYAEETNSEISVTDMVVSASGNNISEASSGGDVSFDNSNLSLSSDNYHGILVNAATSSLTNNSSLITSGASSLAIIVSQGDGLVSQVDITDSSVEDQKYLAMLISGGRTNMNIENSTITSGIGELLSVENAATADINVSDGSLIEGSILTGGNTSNLELSDSTWNMLRTSGVSSLELKESSVVDMRAPTGGAPGNVLSLNSLDGAGDSKIIMNTFVGDDTSPTDKIVLNNATVRGTTILDIRDISTGAGTDTTDGIEIVEALGSTTTIDSNFELLGGKLDSGAYEYLLSRGDLSGADQNSFFLRSNSVMSDTFKTIANMPAIHLSIIKTGMNELNKRMGELRDNSPEHKSGLWVRTYAKHLDIDETIDSKMNLYGVETGYDQQVYADCDNKAYAGIMAGYLYTDNIKTKQSNGVDGEADANTPSVGAYATWLNSEGWFADATVRHFWSDMNVTTFNSQGTTISFDPDRNFITTSLEVGRQFAWKIDNDNKYILEPKAEFQYAYAKAKSFNTSTGNKVAYDDTQSVAGKLSIMAGYNTQLENGVILEPFVKVGVIQEWDGTTDINYENGYYKSDLSGTSFEFGGGLNAKVGENTSLYGEAMLEYGDVVQAVSGNIGLRYNW